MSDRAPDTELPLAAALIPVRPGGDVLLQLRDNRPGLHNANRWATIGGAVEAGETPEEAARRECLEEIGRSPGALVSLGSIDGPRHRSLFFATRASWTLDELIIAEGQGVDWLSKSHVLTLSLGTGVGPGILRFLESTSYRELAAGELEGPSIALAPFSPTFASELGLRPGQLLAVNGASAAFVRRLWDVLNGARVTASLGLDEHPDAVLWWASAATASFEECCDQLVPDGAIWAIPIEGSAEADLSVGGLCAQAHALGLAQAGEMILPTGEHALRFIPPT